MDIEGEITSKLDRVSKKRRDGDERMAASNHDIMRESCWYTYLSLHQQFTMGNICKIMLVEASVRFIFYMP
jgi:hypothetical protein